jgi:hypothetical protein
MGRIVKRVRKSCLFINGFFSFFFFLFVFLPLCCWIVSSGGAPVNRPGLTCYPYSREAYTLSFPSPEERADTILSNGPSKAQGSVRFRYAPKMSAAKSSF